MSEERGAFAPPICDSCAILFSFRFREHKADSIWDCRGSRRPIIITKRQRRREWLLRQSGRRLRTSSEERSGSCEKGVHERSERAAWLRVSCFPVGLNGFVLERELISCFMCSPDLGAGGSLSRCCRRRGCCSFALT